MKELAVSLSKAALASGDILDGEWMGPLPVLALDDRR